MHILLLYLGPYPKFEGFVSGGELHFIKLCKLLYKRGHNVNILTTSVGAQVLMFYGVKEARFLLIKTLPNEMLLCRKTFGIVLMYVLRMIYSIALIPQILKTLGRIDVICPATHYVYDVFPALLIFLLSRLKGYCPKLVLYIHLLIPSPCIRKRYHPMLPSIMSWIAQECSLAFAKHLVTNVFVYPAELVKVTYMYHIPKQKVHIMVQGLDIALIEQVEEEEKEYDACFMARLSPLKGIYDLIKIWDYVRREIPNAKLAIIGSEREIYVNKLKEEIKRRGLNNNVILTGSLTGKIKYSYLKRAKIFIYPSYEDSFALVVLEALACGLPVIAYNIPPMHFFPGDIVYRVPVGDYKRFGDVVIRYLRNYSDIKSLICYKAKTFAKLFDWNTVILREIKILES